MPLESLLIKLGELEYDGHFALDVDPKYLEVGEDATVIRKLQDAKKFLAKYYKKS